jgi:eukaryotic-like serine/threonine-protein kinase
VDRKRQISNDGGVHPKWREDGKEIYYLSPGGEMMAVDILADTNIKPETPHPLFDAKINVDPNKDQYAVARDGQRFLLLRPIMETKLIPITVILNWTSLLKK